MEWLIRLLGGIWWWLLPVRRNEAVESYRLCFPRREPAELRRSVGEMVVQYAELAAGRRAVIEMPPELEKGGIVLAGHGGAWEIAMVSLAERLPVTVFLRRPSGRLARAAVEELRGRAGIEALYGRGVMDRAYRALGEGRVVIFVQDQRHADGIPAKFFGRSCLTSPAFGAMAWRSRAPLYGAWQWREDGKHRCRIEALGWAVPEDRDQAVRVLTQATQDFYQEQISRRPYSWLWLHRRWKA